MLSLIIPVHKSEASLPELLRRLERVADALPAKLEVVCVVDGSPDGSLSYLEEHLRGRNFHYQLLELSRNFGSFAAIVAGLQTGRGDLFAVLAADLQEPPELVLDFYNLLSSASEGVDVVFGQRKEREDPWLSKLSANLFWQLYTRLVNDQIPPGGVDVFACTRRVRDEILQLPERNTSLVGLLFWVGFKRAFVAYTRRARKEGKSAWSFRRKVKYFLDSFFSFTDLPIKLLSLLGLFGMVSSVTIGVIVLFCKLFGAIEVPGYTATVLTVTFFGGLNSLGLGIIGEYVWRTFQNSQQRPNYIVRSRWDDSRESQTFVRLSGGREGIQ